MSGNTVAALPYMRLATRGYVRCGVIYYGMVSAMQNPVAPTARKDLPLMIVRAGLEQSAELNKRVNDFVRQHHSFDLVGDTERSREIIKEALAFLAKHL